MEKSPAFFSVTRQERITDSRIFRFVNFSPHGKENNTKQKNVPLFYFGPVLLCSASLGSVQFGLTRFSFALRSILLYFIFHRFAPFFLLPRFISFCSLSPSVSLCAAFCSARLRSACIRFALLPHVFLCFVSLCFT